MGSYMSEVISEWKFKITNGFARNMFSITNMDFIIGGVTSEGVNSNVWIVQVWGLFG